MSIRRARCLLFPIVIVALKTGLAAHAESPWPLRLIIADDLRPFVELAWTHSPTFREQCRKLAAAGAVVTLRAGSPREVWPAAARIGTAPDGTTVADIRVCCCEGTVEHIAHELEHVLERVEGVTLALEARRPGARVSLAGGAFESGRAIDAGRRVARELQEAAAIQRALALLPRRPARIAVIDANDAKPDTRRTLLTLDAFIVSGSQVIYLVKGSAVLQRAIKGNAVMDHVLASIIWHEMAHAEGADEREAQRREEELWTQFVRDQRMDQVVALRYLSALHKRDCSGAGEYRLP